jgi:hypothetical protein
MKFLAHKKKKKTPSNRHRKGYPNQAIVPKEQ